MSALRLPLLAAIPLILLGCNKPASPPQAEQSESSEDLTAEEKTALAAAKPFLNAIAARDHAAAYQQLSSHAKARMSLNQFVVPSDDAAADANEANALVNPTPDDFLTLLSKAFNHYGSPAKIISSDVMSTDPKELAGKGDAMETAFTIGLMPDSIPVDIRKAAVRSQIGVTLPAAQLKEIADKEGVSVEELQKNEDFAPYCNLKVVLVEEGGALKVGYFEFTPPSMWD